MKSILKGLMVVAMAAVIATPAFAKTASIKVADKEMKLDISGFTQLLYVSAEAPLNVTNSSIGSYALSTNDTFSLNRLQLNFAAQPSDKITVKSVVELGRNFSAANESRIVDAIVDLGYIPGVTLRVGQFALPIGLEIEKSPYDLDFINYTLLSNLAAQRNRGVMIYGDIVESVSFDLGVANGTADGTITGASNQTLSDGKQIFGRMSFVPVQNWTIALFGDYEKYNVAAAAKQKNTLFGIGSAYSYLGWGFEGAYAAVKATTGGVTGVKMTDMYGVVTYKIPETDLQLVARYEQAKDKLANAKAKVLTAGLNWNFDKNARLQLQREFWSSNVANVNKSDVTMLQLGVSF